MLDKVLDKIKEKKGKIWKIWWYYDFDWYGWLPNDITF